MIESTPARARGRRTLVVIALLFIAPLALSFYLYYGGSWRPSGTAQHGKLVSPPRPLPAVSLPTPDGSTTGEDFLRDQWSLVYLGAGACDSRCRQALYETRQVRLSLNQNMDRVRRVFLYTGECCEQPFFGAEHAGLVSADLDGPGGRELLATMVPAEGAGALRAGRIYVVDPLGNLVLSYEPGAEARGMVSDLKRLLKLSHIG